MGFHWSCFVQANPKSSKGTFDVRCKLKKCRQPYLLFFKSITPSLLVTQSSVSGISKTINFAREASVLASMHLFLRFLLLKIDDDSEQDILDIPCILMLFAATISLLLIVSLFLLAVSPVSLSGVFGMKHFEFKSAAVAVDNEDLTMVSKPTNSLFVVFLFTPWISPTTPP